MSRFRSALIVSVAAFALTATVLALLGRGPEDAGRRSAPSALSLGGPLRVADSTDRRIERLTAAVRGDGASADGYTTLGGAFLQKARETADPDFYGRADAALRRALDLRPGDAAALTERAVLHGARHDFRASLADARRALAANPDSNRPYGVLVDALVELGRYGEAERTLQTMIDRKPNLDAYARVAHVRELRGDLAGAAEALELAAGAGGDGPENAAYVAAMAGNLDLLGGRARSATSAYRSALERIDGYAPAEAGLARAAQAAGREELALRRLERLVARLPLPQYTVALGEAQLAAGRGGAARETFALVRAQERLLAAQGVNTDVELALFEADHGGARRAVALARRAYAAAPSVRSADALGWALTRAGRAREGAAWGRRALRLGSREPAFLFHAGMSARAAGRRSEARRLLARALAADPRFSPLHAPRARRALEGLR